MDALRTNSDNNQIRGRFLGDLMTKSGKITIIRVKLQESKETISKTMLLTDKPQSIAILLENDF